MCICKALDRHLCVYAEATLNALYAQRSHAYKGIQLRLDAEHNKGLLLLNAGNCQHASSVGPSACLLLLFLLHLIDILPSQANSPITSYTVSSETKFVAMQSITRFIFGGGRSGERFHLYPPIYN